MPDEKQSGLLRDILDSANKIRQYLEGVSRAQFLTSSEKQDAILRRFEIIGRRQADCRPNLRRCFLIFLFAVCEECEISSHTIMARSTLSKFGPLRPPISPI